MTSAQNATRRASDPDRVADVDAESLGECPACGRAVEDVVAVQLPAKYDDNPGGCLVDAQPTRDFPLALHERFRPDTLVVIHREQTPATDA